MHTFSTPSPVRLLLTLPAGTAQIAAHDGTETTVELTPDDSGRHRDHGAAAELIARTRVVHDGDDVIVAVPDGELFLRRSPALRAVITVPTGSRLELRTASADVRASGTFGDVHVRTASGDLWLDDVTGDVTVKSASGDVTCRSVSGVLSVDTASGDVAARRVGGELAVNLASGDLSVGDLGGSGRCKSASGDISIATVQAGKISATTASGDVTVGVAEGVAVWLDVSSLSGDVTSELPVGDDVPDAAEGTVELHARTLSGDVTVRRSVVAPVG